MAVTPQTNATLEQIAQALLAHDDYVILGHVSPDGDCIGAALALAHALRGVGKRVQCTLATDEASIPSNLRFLPGFEDMVPAASVKSAACAIAVDVPNHTRMGEEGARLHAQAAFTVTMDHHAAPEAISTLNYVDPDAASASTIVWEVAGLLGVPRSKETALCAYTGLVTDTGRFQYQNADPRAFRLAAEMIEAGADVPLVSTEIFCSCSLPSLKLESLMLDHMELLMDGALAISWVSLEDFASASAVKADADNLVNVLRSIEGVRVVCILRETEDNIRGSLRAKDDTDISLFANAHNGGGHKAASGMTLFLPLNDAIAQIRAELPAYLQDAWNAE